MTNIEQILKKLEGQLTNQEEADFQNWLGESDENLRFFEAMQMLHKKGKGYHQYQRIDVDAAWDQVLQKDQLGRFAQPTSLVNPFRNLFSRYQVSIAAAIALLIATTALLFYLQVFSSEVSMQTAYGEKKTFVLPDDSEVVLNANSRLYYSKNQPRKIRLEGEAFFKVSKKPATGAKFWVVTNDLEIEVLGTAFNVNSHQGKTKVYLEEGSVKLDLQNDTIPEIILIPGETFTYSPKNGKSFEKNRSETGLERSWLAGIQLFEETPLQEVLKKMEDLYGVSIELKDSNMADLEMTMGIPIENLNIALATIENTLALKITRINRTTFVLE